MPVTLVNEENEGSAVVKTPQNVSEGQDIVLFEGPGARGTRATVFWGPAPEKKRVAEFSRHSVSEALCWLWEERGTPRLRCFNAGQPIVFCGHGILACAYSWWQRYGAPPQVLETDGQRHDLVLEDGHLWLCCPRHAFRETGSIPREWFGDTTPVASEAGGKNGYLVLRWPAGFDLRTLEPDFEAIARGTTRALIATAAAPPGNDCDATLRYFAPQYGNPEDSVTGSACALLAAYWPGSALTFRQCSQRGGLVKSRKRDNTVLISGSIRKA